MSFGKILEVLIPEQLCLAFIMDLLKFHSQKFLQIYEKAIFPPARRKLRANQGNMKLVTYLKEGRDQLALLVEQVHTRHAVCRGADRIFEHAVELAG